MESELSWEQFIKYAEQIEREAISLGDNWKILGDRMCPGEAYLHHKCVQRSPKTLKPLRWEHHVCYSLCYSVPIIYFNVWNENGTLLPLADVWEFCHPHYKYIYFFILLKSLNFWKKEIYLVVFIVTLFLHNR